MITLVLDASVAAKWALPQGAEPLGEQADELLKAYVANKIRFLVPDLFWVEIASVLCKAGRLGEISRSSAQGTLRDMRRRDFTTVASQSLVDDAMEIALDFQRSVYDSIYVALAVSSRSQLITADERLANALAARFPVKWLGALRDIL